MPLIEGYGLTEGGVVCFNPLDRPKSGSIGMKLPGVHLRLADDGELLVRSPSLFSGYYKDPVTTAAVLRDGWLYTGDIAEFDADNYVYITGRKKELIVSSNGKKIYPSRIEGLFKTEPLINQVVLIGDRLPYVTALLTLNTTDAAASVVAEVGMSLGSMAAPPFEQIRKFRVSKGIFHRDRRVDTYHEDSQKSSVGEPSRRGERAIHGQRGELMSWPTVLLLHRSRRQFQRKSRTMATLAWTIIFGCETAPIRM